MDWVFFGRNDAKAETPILCEELTHWKRLWCWKGLGAGGKGDDRGWDGWMASLTQWTWVWVNSGSWWWTGRPGMLQFMGSQRVGHDWATELNWTHFPDLKTNFNKLGIERDFLNQKGPSSIRKGICKKLIDNTILYDERMGVSPDIRNKARCPVFPVLTL